MLLAVTLVIVFASTIARAEIPPIVTEVSIHVPISGYLLTFPKGSKFFYSNNGSQFLVRGIHYGDYFSRSDSDTGAFCSRDVKYFRRLGINTLFIADAAPESLKNECMEAFQNAGLYVVFECCAQVRYHSAVIWDHAYYKAYKNLIDSASKFPNVLGILTTIWDCDPSWAARLPETRELVQEMKKYIRDMGYRTVLIGVSGYNHRKSRYPLEYLTCGDMHASPDWYMVGPSHSYSRENESYVCTDDASMGNELINLYRGSPLPVLLRYFSCLETKPDDFREIEHIYSPQMMEVFSGGLLAKWQPDTKEALEYGMLSGR
jgi:1,3-beta-glucanosyltransferase GAS1